MPQPPVWGRPAETITQSRWGRESMDRCGYQMAKSLGAADTSGRAVSTCPNIPCNTAATRQYAICSRERLESTPDQ